MDLTNFCKLRKISHKVWLSITIFLVAYSITSAQPFISKGMIRKELSRIGSSTEKSTISSQVLLSNLEKQMKLYQDAVVVAEVSLIDEAVNHMQAALKELDELMGIKYNRPETLNTIDSLKKAIPKYGKDAIPVYTALINGNESEEIFEQSLYQLLS